MMREVAHAVVFRNRPREQRLREAEDARQRRPELMRDRGDEVGPHPVCDVCGAHLFEMAANGVVVGDQDVAAFGKPRARNHEPARFAVFRPDPSRVPLPDSPAVGSRHSSARDQVGELLERLAEDLLRRVAGDVDARGTPARSSDLSVPVEREDAVRRRVHDVFELLALRFRAAVAGEGVVHDDERDEAERERPEVVLRGEPGEQADRDVRGEQGDACGGVVPEVLPERAGAEQRAGMREIVMRLTASKTSAPAVTATIAIRDPEVPPPSASTASIPTAAASVMALTLKNAFVQPRRVTMLPKTKPSATAATTAGVGSRSASATMYASSCVVVSPVDPPRTSRVPKRCSSPIANANASDERRAVDERSTGDHQQQPDGGDGQQRDQRDVGTDGRCKHPARVWRPFTLDPMTLVTTVVGSYPQPDWLLDRERLGERLPPRVRARELWRVPEPFLEEAQDDATRLASRTWSAPAST